MEMMTVLLWQQIVSCEIDTPGVGVVKFLKSNNTLIEFIGLGESFKLLNSLKTLSFYHVIIYLSSGLVRAIDPVKQRYYMTTPLSLSPELLDCVNVLAIGHTDSLPHISG